MTNEEASQRAEDLNRAAVPVEWVSKFTPVNIMPDPIFGFGGLQRVPVCHRCGALVYPTALDRHWKTHEVPINEHVE